MQSDRRVYGTRGGHPAGTNRKPVSSGNRNSTVISDRRKGDSRFGNVQFNACRGIESHLEFRSPYAGRSHRTGNFKTRFLAEFLGLHHERTDLQIDQDSGGTQFLLKILHGLAVGGESLLIEGLDFHLRIFGHRNHGSVTEKKQGASTRTSLHGSSFGHDGSNGCLGIVDLLIVGVPKDHRIDPLRKNDRARFHFRPPPVTGRKKDKRGKRNEQEAEVHRMKSFFLHFSSEVIHWSSSYRKKSFLPSHAP